eukprot:4936028-Pleurochrysis_carterae.AAC.10
MWRSINRNADHRLNVGALREDAAVLALDRHRAQYDEHCNKRYDICSPYFAAASSFIVMSYCTWYSVLIRYCRTGPMRLLAKPSRDIYLGQEPIASSGLQMAVAELFRSQELN